MVEHVNQPSSSWTTFSYASFGAAALMTGLGIFFLPLGLAVKGYLAMAAVMLVQSTVNLTKTLRDKFEADRLVHRIEDAKTEKLLKEAALPDPI